MRFTLRLIGGVCTFRWYVPLYPFQGRADGRRMKHIVLVQHHLQNHTYVTPFSSLRSQSLSHRRQSNGRRRCTDPQLRADKILQIAKLTSSEAIHPGYGFMSESTTFAQQVTEAGMVFIGPLAEAIRSMGSKRESKEIMLKAGVPCVP